MSAIEQIESAGFQVQAVGDDLVTVADIAARAGRSQQTISAWINQVRGPGGFPAPYIDRHWGAVYSWGEVATWLAAHQLGDADPATAHLATVCATVNAVLQARTRLRSLPGPAAHRARRLLAACPVLSTSSDCHGMSGLNRRRGLSRPGSGELSGNPRSRGARRRAPRAVRPTASG